MKRIIHLAVAGLAAALVAGTLLAGIPKDQAQKAAVGNLFENLAMR